MAGIGTGALTMNPLIGMGMRDQIVKAPLRDAQRQNSQEIAQRQGNQKALGEVSGLQATLSQRNSQADEARAAGQNAQTNTRNAATNATKTQYEIDHPEVSTETFVAPGDTEASVQQVPKRAGTGVAPKKLGGAKPEAGQFQVETSADGKSMVQINKTTGETMQLTLPPGTQLNAQQVSDMAKYVNQSITEKPGTSPKAAMDEYLSRSRPNFGLATGEAARAAGDADTTEAETTTATISAAIAKLGIKDPTEAYNRFNDTLDKLLARRPELAKNADKIRAAGKAKYPGAGRAPSKSNPIDFGKALDDKKPTPGTK
jgi:hypothetical protein